MALILYILMIPLLLVLHVGVGCGQPAKELLQAKIQVYANEDETYGVETSVVITMEKYPTLIILLRLSTQKYLLAYQEVGIGAAPIIPVFSYTEGISKELQLLNITPSLPVLYEMGFYMVVKATFWETSHTVLTLEGTIPSKRHVEAVREAIKIHVKLPTLCVPQLNVMRCANPAEPQKASILRSINVRSFFTLNCGMSEANLTWTVMDFLGTTVLKTIPNRRLSFTFMRFELRFPTKYELWRNLYLIHIGGEFEGRTFAARCYLEALMENVEAIISGGKRINAYRGRNILMDGSMSRDYSKRKRVRQFKLYHWDCNSYDDYYNTVCRRNISKVAKFVIPRYAFSLDCRYEFMLRVVADDDPKLVSRMWQAITIVNYDNLHVAIVCHSNCAMDLYNPKNKVMLSAKCLNCEGQKISYSWFVGGQFTLSSKTLATYIRTDKTLVYIRMEMSTNDGRSGSETKMLQQNIPPMGGKCSINPTVGIEAMTRFYVCCENFHTKHEPIEYFFYANRVLLNRCHTCNCASHLPLHLHHVKVLICDNLLTCLTKYVAVKVTPVTNISVASPQAMWDCITKPPHDVLNLAVQGRLMRFLQTIQSLATRISTSEMGMVLMRAYSYVHPVSLSALGKLANLTHTLALQMTPIDQGEQVVLIHSLCKLNEVFEAVYQADQNRMLIEEPFVNVTISCVTVYNIMNRLNKPLPRPPQAIFDMYMDAFKENTLDLSLVIKLQAEIADYDLEEAKLRSMVWLNSTWETERLYRYLYLARKHGLQADFSDVNAQGVSLEIQCFTIEPDRMYTIDTSDKMHTVNFTAELLQEAKEPDTDYICLKVISTIRELNWWYPEEKQPSSVLLSVRIYVDQDNFKHERQLHHSEISFRTIIGKYKPAVERPDVSAEETKQTQTEELVRKPRFRQEIMQGLSRNSMLDDDENEDFVADTGKFVNCLEHGRLETMKQVRIYRINLDEQSMLAVRFKNTTHQLRALLILGDPPKKLRQAIAQSGCIVPANSYNTTMLIRNNCMDLHRVYIAVQAYGGLAYDDQVDKPVPKGPALYSFVFQMRSCDYWIYTLPADSQRWAHVYCLPGLEYPRKGSMTCTCKLLGTYTSYVYHVPAILVPTDEHIVVTTNMVLVILFYTGILVLIFWLTALFIWHNKRPSKTVVCDMTGLEDDSHREVHDLLVFLKTGGRTNAQTTATVRLIFQTTQRTELQFTLMQDPEHPELTRNSTYILWLRTRDIRIPTRVAVSHNNAGRYPAWFLRSIELVDLQTQLTQVFVVRRWVRHKFLVLSSSLVFRQGDERAVGHWRQRFVSEFERQWINWGLWQPLFGKWRDNNVNNSLTRAQRVCIFVSKIMVTYCVCACFLGPTTAETAYADRKKILDYHELFMMFIICCVATNLVHFLLEYIILRKLKCY